MILHCCCTMSTVNPNTWRELLVGRGVDGRITDLVCELAAVRTIEPPTTETKQLLVALEQDGYAAGRLAGKVLSLFFDPDARGRQRAARHVRGAAE